jgi:hypothetical protein
MKKLSFVIDAKIELNPSPRLQPNDDEKSPGEIPEDDFEKGIKKNFLNGIKKSGIKPTPKVTNDEFEALKTEFQQNLSKLSNKDTKKVGLEKCQTIISNNTDPIHLRMYLSQL